MSNHPLRLGIAGLGTVGVSLINVLNKNAEMMRDRCGREIVVTAVNARDKSRDRGVDLSSYQWFDNAQDMASSDDIDVFVELIGGEEGVALEASQKALKSGKHVVTANKAMLAKHGVSLAKEAEAQGVLLNFEAAVAGGIPIIKTMRETLTANNVERVYGIMNGTCNYMLTRMEREGISYDDCLADAQALGYAEADPTFDVEGFDTAHKLAILRVHPTMVPLDSSIAQISGVTNAVAIDADIVGNLVMSGPGAGGDATASAVAGDIADIAKCAPGEQKVPALGKPASELAPYKQAEMQSHEGGYFIRMTVKDHAGVFAAIASAMAKFDISLESIVQHGEQDDAENADKTIILITHATTESAVREALGAIGNDEYLSSQPQMIRIEK